MNHQLDARTGIREALPTVFGYIGIGIAFGIVGQAAGFSPLIVSAMSFFIFAGSAQFVTVSVSDFLSKCAYDSYGNDHCALL